MGEPREGLLILGTPRSGTTLLRRLLDAHGSFACPGETHVFRGAARFLETERTVGGTPLGVVPGLVHAGFAEAEVVARLREFAFSFHRDHARRQGKRRWAEKTGFDVFHLDGIERICEQRVHYVCVVRHGLDVVMSLRDLCDRTGSYLLEVHDYVREHRRPMEAFAHLWRDATADLLSLVDRRPGDAILVHYEQLVADPAPQLRRILEFVGEPWEDGLVERALERTDTADLGDWKTWERPSVDAESVGRWRALAPETLEIVAPIVNPLLRELGHEEIEPRPENTPEARTRYLSGLLHRLRKATE